MDKKNEDFLKKLLATFELEAEEHIVAISSGLLELEKAPAAERQMEIIETVFREAHSLKGAARAVNLTETVAICQSLESVFAALKLKKASPSPELFDRLHQALGSLERSSKAALGASERSRIQELTDSLESASTGGTPPPHQAEATERADGAGIPTSGAGQPSFEDRPVLAETVRISTSKLDSLLRQVEELLSAKLALRQRAAELREINAMLAAWKKESARIRPDVRTLGQLLEKNVEENGQQKRANPSLQRLLHFQELCNTCVKSVEGRLAAIARSVDQDQRIFGGMVETLLEDTKELMMLPISSILEAFPKLVRDLSRDRNKDVELQIQGREIEIDRRILEQIKDPLIHLVKNCIDHGIEHPEERKQKQKSARGLLRLAVTQKAVAKVEICVSDDGAGIDQAKVRSAALKLGIVSHDDVEKLGERETLSLIFESAVSTSPIITDISGRGIGLAIVREKVEKLGGVISMETQPDRGTAFRLVLPLTLARFRGILVRVGEQVFVLPTTNVERVVRIKQEDIKTAGNREAIQVEGKAVAVARLRDVLELRDNVSGRSHAEAQAGTTKGVVLVAAEKRMAFLVDEVVQEQEVLVKNLGKQLSRLRNVAGATVLGTGRVVPILNVLDLMKSAVKLSPPSATTRTDAVAEEVRPKPILVVEDSITARTLLKNILEAAGYSVGVAVDGVEALTVLRSEDFELVVSDVEMPRMNGFELTARMRADRKLSELPIVLVTALESREDRERGIEVGASAYLVKSSFDQGNLLETIRRLI